MKSIQETIEDLRTVVAELEGNQGLTLFVGGHGLQSRRFQFEWSDDVLSIDFNLPCLRILSDEEDQRSDDEEISAACRMAILLLATREAGTLLKDGESSIAVSCSDDGTYYQIRDAEGEVLDEGDDWQVLVGRLESALPESASLSIIWP